MPITFAQTLPKDVGSAAEARRALDRLQGEVDERRLADARLLVTELVANAVRHVDADGEIELCIDSTDERLRVEVTDPGSGFDHVPARPDPGRGSGWGLHFVNRLSDRWAAEVDGRTRVWFELNAR
jgi:anti-sigma regulatory factor (Ser/Thr protein kinase)